MLKKILFLGKKQRGFTLLELLIAFAIGALVAGSATTAIMQVFNNSARSSNHMTAVRDAQMAGGRLSHDAKMAQEVTEGASSGFPLTLEWRDWTGSQHQVVYNVSGTNLVRTYTQDAGSPTDASVARHINSSGTSVVWDEVNNVLTFTVMSTVGVGSQQGNETRVYEVIPRPSL